MKSYFKTKPKLQNREYGKRAFILGNGPSIKSEDLSKLSNEITIGMNASTLLEKQYGFTQTYYCLSDARFINHPEKRKWATQDIKLETLRVVRKDICQYDDENLSNQTYYIPHIKRDGFSHNLGVGFYYGCTTSMLAVQLAYYLGCSEVYLLGIDLRYSPESPRFYKEANPQLEDSFTSVQIWNLANAGKIMEENGRRLINCSEQSLLKPYLPYLSFNELFL